MARTPKHLTDPIEAIAQKHLDIETLETRSSDALDFHELPVWQIRQALQAAYIAGSEARGRLEAEDNRDPWCPNCAERHPEGESCLYHDPDPVED